MFHIQDTYTNILVWYTGQSLQGNIFTTSNVILIHHYLKKMGRFDFRMSFICLQHMATYLI